MGVIGLESLVHENSSTLLENHNLKSTRLVVDGCSLYHHLFKTGRTDCRFGGEYSHFASTVESFFTVLKTHDIQTRVYLDGPLDPHNHKQQTRLGRLNTRLLAGKQMLEYGVNSRKLFPLMLRDVFVETLLL